MENEDPSAFGAGAIRFEVNAKVEDFDHYKDSFENYQEIADREIGGITFHGRTYKYIGYGSSTLRRSTTDAHYPSA